MSELEWYKKQSESCTALVFGEVFANRPPVTNNILLGQRAYECYQVFVYLENILLTRNDPKNVDWSPLFCALYAGIIASGATKVVEIGSTLFGTIDKLEKLCKLSDGPPVNHLEYIGIEPSVIFRQVAEALHPGYRISYVETPDYQNSVTRCYQATSYAFDTTQELVEYCSQSSFGSQGIWFSTDGTTKKVSTLGKRLTLFNAPEFVDEMERRGFRVEFVANSRCERLNSFDFFETWLIYHCFSESQDEIFRRWLKKMTAITGESGTLYSSMDAVPVGVRISSATQSQSGGSFNFTTNQSMMALSQWYASMGTPMRSVTQSSSLLTLTVSKLKSLFFK